MFTSGNNPTVRHGMKNTAKAKFHAQMLALYDRCASLGFRPVALRRLTVLKGGVEAARELVFQPGTTGLERLLEAGKADLSMEAAMIRAECRDLFTPHEIREAERRLESGASRERSRGRLAAPVPNTRQA